MKIKIYIIKIKLAKIYLFQEIFGVCTKTKKDIVTVHHWL